MTPERFAELAQAYGGNMERWPSGERDAARAHAATSFEARDMLEAAAQLDSMLAGWTVPAPGAALAGRIAATLAQRHARRNRVRLWLSSLGAATALTGGVAAGALAVTSWAPPSDDGTSAFYELSVLGAPLGTEPSSGESSPF